MMCIAVASLSISDAIAKNLIGSYSSAEILFLRNAIALPIALLITLKMGGVASLCSYRPFAHLLRGALWLGATALFLTSMVHLTLAEATTLSFMAPVFITAISSCFLGERVAWHGWLPVTGGFVGVLIVTRPGTGAFQPASLLSVGSAFFHAFLLISARLVDPRESVWTLSLYLTGTSAILSGLIVPFVWSAPRVDDLLLFIGIALFGTVGQTLMTQAFRLSPAAVVAPIDYSALLWSISLGWLFWSEIPDLTTILGAIVVALSGILLISGAKT
ncbi:DMT family transporter [Sinorhizobium sp. 8-89]|uniref:DMT family transporter n=1 Tax=Sinorhizobium sp. 7-81 TaxID=3049087 RepID=UPI0024C422D6|nr:DMT family transporter [Sinorhizobium sp. 7-81]MDK1389780.1 DMT family transporter [Sinorhizobium sp. 7-81]